MKCNLEGREYTVFGYKGKQVRDNIHSLDVARFMDAFVDRAAARRGLQPRRRQGQLLLDSRGVHDRREAHRQAAAIHATSSRIAIGDHICYYSDLRQDARALSGVGHHASHLDDDDRRDRRGVGSDRLHDESDKSDPHDQNQPAELRAICVALCGPAGLPLPRVDRLTRDFFQRWVHGQAARPRFGMRLG